MAKQIVSTAETNLSNIEERLRRSLNLVGLIQAGFQAEALPFVLVDDATRPGCNLTNGRHFSITIRSAFAAATSWAIKAQNAVIINHFSMSVWEAALPKGNPALQIQALLQHSSVADPFAIATQNTGSFTESLGSNTDRPPILQSVPGATAFAVAQPIGSWSCTPESPWVHAKMSVHLRTGDKLGFIWTPVALVNAYNAEITLQGTTF